MSNYKIGKVSALFDYVTGALRGWLDSNGKENIYFDQNGNPTDQNGNQLASVQNALNSVKEPTDATQWTKNYLFGATDTVSPTIYWFFPFNTESRIANATHKWYVYWSTDHDATLGGIYLSKTNDLANGPWVQAGLVYRDLATSGSNSQTETPSVLWDSDNSRMVMYYQNQGAQYGASNSVNAKGVQSTLMAYSTDGVNFTKDPNFIIDIPFLTSQLGDGHTGYFMPFKTRRGLFAYSLYGGTNFYQSVLWKNEGLLGGVLTGGKYLNGYASNRMTLGFGSDAVYNVTDPVFGTNQKNIQWHESFVVEIHGVEYWIGMVGIFVSGGGARVGRIGIAPISSDYRSLLETPKMIWSPTQSWESDDIRSITYAIDGSYLRVFYTLASLKVGVISYAI